MHEDPPDVALFLHNEATSDVRWAVTKDADVLLATTVSGATIHGTAMSTVRDSLPAVDGVPTPCAPERWPAIEAILPRPISHSCAVATVTTVNHVNIAALSNRGLEVIELDCSRQAPWRLATVPHWMLPGVIAPDTPAMCTTLEGYSASIVRVGSLVLLGLRWRNDNTGVWRLAGLSQDLRLARLGHELGLPFGTVQVESLVHADSLATPVVVNAQLVDCHVTYRAAAAGDSTDDQTLAAVELLLPTFDPPTLPSADRKVMHSLADVIAQLPQPAVRRVAVVPQITDTWTTKDHRRAVTYDLSADRQAAVIRDFVTNERVSRAQLDRGGHFIADAQTCPYCREISCARCEIAVAECAVCAQPICSKCVERLSVTHAAAPRLCPACSTLSSEPHGGGVRRGLGGVHLVGLDPLHQVKVSKGRNGVWEVEGRATPLAGAGAIAYLDGLVSDW